MGRSSPTASRRSCRAGDLTVVANTGDDTERHGLLVMPDHDAVMYMLANRFDDARGWGLAGETWTVMDGLAEYGEPAWFRLGDRDFATHIARSARLAEGGSLTAAVRSLQTALGIPTAILPMADEPVRTQVRTDEGWLDFQEYFVHRHQAPEVREIRYDGIEGARPTAEVERALAEADVVIVGPSNPLVSIGPILAVPGMTEAIGAARARGVPVVAVSGIVGGVALKGPADRMLTSLGFESSARGVAAAVRRHHRRVRARRGRRGARARHRGARAAHAGDRHDHGRPRWAGTAGPDRPRVRPMTRIAAIIPVGTLDGAKTRLAEALDAEERHDLVEDLLARTVVTAVAVDRLDDVLVVSPDREVLRRAADLGARTLRQRSSGLNRGLTEARADVVAGGATSILVLPIDLPFVSVEAVTAVLEALERRTRRPAPRGRDDAGRGPRHGPARHRHQRAGLRPPEVIDFAFGPGSRDAHRAAAEAAGARYEEVGGALAVDLDTADDLVYVESQSTEGLRVG